MASDIDILISEAVTQHNNGAWADAEKLYRQILDRADTIPEIFNNLAVIYHATNRIDEAVGLLNKALMLRPDYPSALHNLGLSLGKKGLNDDSVICFQKAIQLQPDDAGRYLALGNAYLVYDDFDQALLAYSHALKLGYRSAEIYNNLGVVFLRTFDFDKARAHFMAALDIQSDYVKAYNNMGLLMKELDDVQQAKIYYSQAISIDPNYFLATHNLGCALIDEGGIAEALVFQREALKSMCVQMNISASVEQFCLVLIELQDIPILYASKAELYASRKKLIHHIREADKLCKALGSLSQEERQLLVSWLFNLTNFYLTYQQRNDVNIQRVYARMASFILSEEINAINSSVNQPGPANKIRIGVASEFLRNHNGSNWSYDWLANLPQDDYEIFAYSLNGQTDNFTELFASLGTYTWLPFRENSFMHSLKKIKEDQLDILLIPDVGMSVPSKIISLFRLAPVQCVGWGHPVTTGSPAIDYYLSGGLMESSSAQKHYSEALIRLPNVGLYLKYLVPEHSLSRSFFGLPEKRLLFGCLQTLFKYLPQYDYLFTAIAKRLPGVLFVFLEYWHKPVTKAFEKRLRSNFLKEGLCFEDHVLILPRVSSSEFIQLFSLIDVNLDSIGWNGGNTTVQAITMDCPVVTYPGKYMRGRHSYAMLKMIGVEELISDSLETYVEIATNLGRDKTFRDNIKEKISRNKHALFYDQTCIEFLDKFFKKHAKEARNNHAIT